MQILVVSTPIPRTSLAVKLFSDENNKKHLHFKRLFIEVASIAIILISYILTVE